MNHDVGAPVQRAVLGSDHLSHPNRLGKCARVETEQGFEEVPEEAKGYEHAPEVEIETAKGESPKVINIMDALKKSMQAKGQAKVKDVVRKRMGKVAPKQPTIATSPRSKPSPRRTAH